MSIKVGVVGGGQLARMMIAPASELGIEIRVLAEEEGMSAALAASAVGDYKDFATVLEFAKGVDVVTFDHEHVPQAVLRALQAEGVAVHPGPDALRFAQDKLVMRKRLAELGAPQPAWAEIRSEADLADFIAEHGPRVIVKTPRGGYDGKGVRVVDGADQVSDWFGDFESLLAEQLVDFSRELAQQLARNSDGEVALYPVVETMQRDGVCAEVIAPAPNSANGIAAEAALIAEQIAAGVGITGMFAVELFETTDGQLLVNELAMRPHNSGHWSQDGAVTDQFEQHLRAVLNLPLGDTGMVQPWAVMANILGGPAEEAFTDRYRTVMARYPRVKIHGYDKASRAGRKVGHVNVAGSELDEVVYLARGAAAAFLSETID